LVILVHHQRLTLAEWKLVEERLQKRLSSWKEKLISLGGRLVLFFSRMQLIYRSKPLLRLWSSFQRLEEKTKKFIITQHGWLDNRRILPPTVYCCVHLRILFYLFFFSLCLRILNDCVHPAYAEAGYIA
jgi:hypothetical protein